MNKPLYDRDFYAWTQEQADAIRRRSIDELDWENLQEEVESMGKQQRGELHSHLVILLQHLLKWRFQPERRSRSWLFSILEQRIQTSLILEANPSFRPIIDEALANAYRVARLRAIRETKSPRDEFPEQSPFSFEQVMAEAVDLPEPRQSRSNTRKTKG